jgi:hypothetical protein
LSVTAGLLPLGMLSLGPEYTLALALALDVEVDADPAVVEPLSLLDPQAASRAQLAAIPAIAAR